MNDEQDIHPDVLDRFRELQRGYAADLPQRLEELAAAVAGRDAPLATMLAHRLAGTAGSYGLGQVSTDAGALEARLIEVAANGWEPVERALATLRGR